MAAKRAGTRSANKAPAPATPPSSGGVPIWIISLIVTIPIVVVVLFWQFGGAFQQRDAAPGKAASTQQPHDSDEELAKMAAQLASRLEKNPGDLEGMAMLARTYYTMQDYARAVSVFERLMPLIPDEAAILADYADALAVTQGNDLAGKPMELVQRALTADPTHWKALAMAATDAFRRQDYATAIRHWEKARGSVPAGSDMVRSIDTSIAQARELAAKP